MGEIVYENIALMRSCREGIFPRIRKNLEDTTGHFEILDHFILSFHLISVTDILTFLEGGESLIKAKAQGTLLMNFCNIF